MQAPLTQPQTQLNLTEATTLLTNTPPTLATLLRDLPPSWLHATEGPATWSPLDILGHLLHAERTDWLPRLGIILEHGPSHPFPPFDRFAQQKEPPKTPDQLLHEFATLRTENLEHLHALNLQPNDMTRQGTHPTLGTVTLGQLLATWVAHDLTHLHQLSRVLAHQLRTLVGPWTAYLGVLQCKGHSAG